MILVTGANGFIGARLFRRLKESGRCARAALRRRGSDCEGLIAPELGKAADWRAVLAGASVVVHTAGRAHVLRGSGGAELERFREVNTAGTCTLAEQAAAAGVKRFVFLSSIGVNGNESARPFTESDDPAPKEAYAVSKFEAEQALWAIGKRTGMEVVVLRPPLVYGPGAPGNFGRLLSAVRRGVPLPLGAVTQNRRTLVALDNLVDLLIVCTTHPAAANQLFLAGDGEDLSTADLLNRLARAQGVSLHMLPIAPWVLSIGAAVFGRRAVVERLCSSLQIDITKARRLLDWDPPISVDEGLRRAVRGTRE